MWTFIWIFLVVALIAALVAGVWYAAKHFLRLLRQVAASSDQLSQVSEASLAEIAPVSKPVHVVGVSANSRQLAAVSESRHELKRARLNAKLLRANQAYDRWQRSGLTTERVAAELTVEPRVSTSAKETK
ncbi:hypothetical protein BK816_04415 [Boudabousia tangfeifanii]|uniref:Uncharacterized protein n=1 Tax=Boudabousia tangfeifanii TaxID=1912795 RepID=A0A1D9MKC5_9ACTO|nr:hypothetical protein [Boudabousia tangfeifanii]AOZ72633.1 hypothetical protein BK816_04415 [Boudabousia tangfeifanii]